MNTSLPTDQHATSTGAAINMTARTVNISKVGQFVGLTFGLSWLLDLVLFLTGGLSTQGAGLALLMQMNLPAFSAIVLQTFLFQDSPLYHQTNRTRIRWFTYSFMSMSMIGYVCAVLALLLPGITSVMSQVTGVIVPMTLAVLVITLWRGRKEVFSTAGMAGGSFRWWLIAGLGLIGLYLIQTVLNVLFQLGQFVNITQSIPPELAGWPPVGIQLFMSLNMIILGPFLNIIPFFGEEYGWRGFLQGELAAMGRVKGVFFVGLIWGIWHAPVILMGYNYPEQPVLGVLLMTIFCILASYVFSYGMYKAKGFWPAAYLHGINNNVVNYLFGMVYLPTSMIFSFGVGVYGLIVWALAVLFILRDPVWKETTS